MKRKESSVRLTPEKAQQFITINVHPGQRNLRRRVVQELAEKMADGRFHEGVIAIMHNGKDSLMNGQHQCYAVIESGKTVSVRVHEYWTENGDSETDIAKVFAQYNVDAARSRADIGWIYGAQIGMEEWPRKCVSVCMTALGWIESKFGNVTCTKDENGQLLAENRPACDFVHGLLFSGGDTKHMVRSPVVAAMIVTYERDAADADVFWSSVRDGDMLKRTEPAFKIREYLTKVSISCGRGVGGEKKNVRVFEVCAKCIHAWNAYRGGVTTDLKVYADKPMPSAK